MELNEKRMDGYEKATEMARNMSHDWTFVATCWSSVFEEPGPCWVPAGQGCVGGRESEGVSEC